MVEGAAEALRERVADAVGAEVDDRAATGVLDHLHGLTQGVPGGGGVVAAAVEIVEDVAQQVAPVDADEGGLVALDGVAVLVELADIADGQGEVGHGVDHRAEGDEVELAHGCLDLGARDRIDAGDERGLGEAVLDDLLDAAHLDVVLFAQGYKVGHAGHLAVVAHDLDDDGAGVEPGQSAQVQRALGLADADEHAAVARSERVDVPGLDEVFGLGVGVDSELDGLGAFRGRDAGGEAVLGVAVDGDGEGCAADGGVDG